MDWYVVIHVLLNASGRYGVVGRTVKDAPEEDGPVRS
jgi:hypothetical protein